MWIFFGKLWISFHLIIWLQHRIFRVDFCANKIIIHIIHRIHIFSFFFMAFSFWQYAYFFFVFLMIYFETLIQFDI